MSINQDVAFIDNSTKSLYSMLELINGSSAINISELQPDKSVLVIIDVINGFALEGALRSDRVKNLIPSLIDLSRLCDKSGIKKIAFADNHPEDSPEFNSYPRHCIKGTSECEMVDDLKELGGYELIAKNSTNGFLEEEFQTWLKENNTIRNFIVTGDCTDICILQFALSLKTYFNKNNLASRIIVPINNVETYDLGAHYADLMNVFSLYNMSINGIEVVKEII